MSKIGVADAKAFERLRLCCSLPFAHLKGKAFVAHLPIAHLEGSAFVANLKGSAF